MGWSFTDSLMLDVMYDLEEGEPLADLEGEFLLVLLNSGDPVCELYERQLLRVLRRVPEESPQFYCACLWDDSHAALHDELSPSGYPAIYHYSDGVRVSHENEAGRYFHVQGVDGCEEFMEEFLSGNLE